MRLDLVRWIGIAAIATVLPASAKAADLLVPQQYGSIQAAVNASVDGDRVLVSPGTYNELVLIEAKSITIEASGAASVTKIDRQNAGGDVFTIRNAPSPGVTLRKFTISRCAGKAIDVTNAALEIDDVRVLNTSKALSINSDGIVDAELLQGLFLTGGTGAGVSLNHATSRLTLANSTFQAVTGG